MEEGQVQRQPLGEVDRLADGLLSLAGQPNDKVTPIADAGLLGPAQRTFYFVRISALARPAQDLLRSRLNAPGDHPAARLTHQSQHFLVDVVHATVARPANFEPLLNDGLTQAHHLIPTHGEQISIHVDVVNAQVAEQPQLFHDMLR